MVFAVNTSMKTYIWKLEPMKESLEMVGRSCNASTGEA